MVTIQIFNIHCAFYVELKNFFCTKLDDDCATWKLLLHLKCILFWHFKISKNYNDRSCIKMNEFQIDSMKIDELLNISPDFHHHHDGNILFRLEKLHFLLFSSCCFFFTLLNSSVISFSYEVIKQANYSRK